MLSKRSSSASNALPISTTFTPEENAIPRLIAGLPL
ncbi:hypothetical protein MED222_06385 [Vibrio sp. MED222]|nr:hypothetical protein MED222_06385 [Vibrio sp. MED222]